MRPLLHTFLNATIIQELKNSSAIVLAYTVNEYNRAQELFSWAVDAIITDRPDIFKENDSS